MVLDQEQLLNDLYNAFDPYSPLPAGDPNYVDCGEVRGDGNILLDLGNRIKRSQPMTCHLYSGHRGAGKSTELLRLKQFLEEQKFFVVYFAADEEDIQSEDAQYTDILLACTRRLLEDLQDAANPNPLLEWLRERWQELKELASTNIDLEKATLQVQIAQFSKITANLRAEPTMRAKIRDKINPHTVSLIEVLNQFIREAKQKLPGDKQELAVIVDNLDRIVPIVQEKGSTNHEDIFINRNEQLRALDCHLVYTVPISLLYSPRATDIRDIYSDNLVLPMIMVRDIRGEIYQPGVEKIKEIIYRRVRQFTDLPLETEIFDSADTLEKLALMSGGHVRNLLLLMQDAIGRTENLPISKRAVQIAVTRARDVYRRTVNDNEWQLLAEVSQSKRVINDDKYRSLLFNRCLLEYCYYDEEGEIQRWCDVHPLIRGIAEFKEALDKI